jgi:hypothetical protein
MDILEKREISCPAENRITILGIPVRNQVTMPPTLPKSLVIKFRRAIELVHVARIGTDKSSLRLLVNMPDTEVATGRQASGNNAIKTYPKESVKM